MEIISLRRRKKPDCCRALTTVGSLQCLYLVALKSFINAYVLADLASCYFNFCKRSFAAGTISSFLS